jgi:hypothetical protein
MGTLNMAVDELARSSTEDLAKKQLVVLNRYYAEVLSQSKTGFWGAVITASVGLLVFIGVIWGVRSNAKDIAVIASAVGGGIMEFLAGVQFVLYNRTTLQLSEYHQRLDQQQRFLLADDFCEKLSDPALKDKSRAELVTLVATRPPQWQHELETLPKKTAVSTAGSSKQT